MNQPYPDLIDTLEAEYLSAAAAGDFKAMDYAQAESDPLNQEVTVTLMSLMRARALSQSDPHYAQAWIEGRCEDLMKILTGHVAPAWALAEYPKRVAATQEMVAEWEREAA